MPALGIADNDATDLIAYLQAQTVSLNEAQTPTVPGRQHHNH